MKEPTAGIDDDRGPPERRGESNREPRWPLWSLRAAPHGAVFAWPRRNPNARRRTPFLLTRNYSRISLRPRAIQFRRNCGPITKEEWSPHRSSWEEPAWVHAEEWTG